MACDDARPRYAELVLALDAEKANLTEAVVLLEDKIFDLDVQASEALLSPSLPPSDLPP